MDERQLLMNDAPVPLLKKNWKSQICGVEDDPSFQRQLCLGSDRPKSCKEKLIRELKARREALGWSAEKIGDRLEHCRIDWNRRKGIPPRDEV